MVDVNVNRMTGSGVNVGKIPFLHRIKLGFKSRTKYAKNLDFQICICYQLFISDFEVFNRLAIKYWA